MTTRRPSPLVGYNTGVTYKGTPYHVQTEDSGVDHPHVITHLFAEGGHIIATRKAGYAEHVGTPAYPDAVRELIRAQHKQMIIDLRDGVYDEVLPEPSASTHAPLPSAMAPAAASTQEAAPAEARRARRPRTTFPGADRARDSLDEIILAEIVDDLDA